MCTIVLVHGLSSLAYFLKSLSGVKFSPPSNIPQMLFMAYCIINQKVHFPTSLETTRLMIMTYLHVIYLYPHVISPFFLSFLGGGLKLRSFTSVERKFLQSKRLLIVKSQWLEDCLESSQRLPEETYSLKPSGTDKFTAEDW